jgi:2-polyprenyl-3-methyl-5-hydroxy-6-metoxy-1,4-benzoquinol methylase
MTVAGHSFRRCGECRTLWVEDPPEQTASLYGGERYFTNPEFAPPEDGSFLGYKDYLADRPHIEAKFAEVLEHVERFVPPGRLLDVGAGPGFLLSAARDRGWQVRGVDLNEWAAAYARESLGIEVTAETLEHAGFEDASFDAVTMMDLVEHVAEPSALVAEAARVLRPGGVLAVLTPDAGSPVSRALGARWPEVKRAGEHLVLLSVQGAASVLGRAGFAPVGWHSVGKTSSAQTLLADVSPTAPALGRALAPVLEGTALGRRELDFDPHTKFVIYGRRREAGDGHAIDPFPRLPKRVDRPRETEEAVLDELRTLAGACRLCDWMFEQFAGRVRGDVAEIGAGIGTFSRRLLDAGAASLLLVEPEPGCAAELERGFASDPRVEIVRDSLPGSPALAQRAGSLDFVLCQNVLEHVEDHRGAVAAMAAALRPGGDLTLLVPALPRLYGSLDVAYGHWRRYSPALLRDVVESAGLELADSYYFNALGIPGWWAKNRGGSAGIGPLALRAYEALVRPWRALERRARPPLGLSLVAHARRPPDST